MTEIPISTKWTIEAANDAGKQSVKFVYMILTKNGDKGTGFLLSNGILITNEHVVRGCEPADVTAISSFDNHVKISNIITDPFRDLALLIPSSVLRGGLEMDKNKIPNVGDKVLTWGFPLGYSGPNPLLSVGYLSGFREQKKGKRSVKRLVVNGAINPGNSGGPLFCEGNGSIIGIVVAKHAPLTCFQKSALKVLSKQKSGNIYTAKGANGIQVKFTEAQLVADLLKGLLKLAQVMIGEAVAMSELAEFLGEQDID